MEESDRMRISWILRMAKNASMRWCHLLSRVSFRTHKAIAIDSRLHWIRRNSPRLRSSRVDHRRKSFSICKTRHQAANSRIARYLRSSSPSNCNHHTMRITSSPNSSEQAQPDSHRNYNIQTISSPRKKSLNGIIFRDSKPGRGTTSNLRLNSIRSP